MSKDLTIYVLDDLDINVDNIIDSNTLNESYFYSPIKYSFDVLKDCGKKVMIKYHYTDYTKLCLDYFKRDWDHFNLIDDEIEFYYENMVLGRISKSILKEYTKDTEELSYIVKLNDEYRINNVYPLSLTSGIYSFNELFDEVNRLIETIDDTGYFYELIYGLIKAMKKVREGKEVYLEVD